MNENRNKLVRLLAVANAAIAVDEIIPDEEIDRVWNMKYSAIIQEARQDGGFSEEKTFGELIDYLWEEMMDEHGVKLPG